MSNFWAQKLGVQQAAPAPPVQPVQTPWYAPPQFPQYPQVPQQQFQQPQAPAAPEQQNGWGTVEGSLRKAQSARSTEVCPACGSGNVFRPSQNAMLQCFECGENPRFTQSGAGGGLPSGNGTPSTPARQVDGAGRGGVSQYNPANIVGRI